MSLGTPTLDQIKEEVGGKALDENRSDCRRKRNIKCKPIAAQIGRAVILQNTNIYGAGSMLSPAIAKNIIAVGASEASPSSAGLADNIDEVHVPTNRATSHGKMPRVTTPCRKGRRKKQTLSTKVCSLGTKWWISQRVLHSLSRPARKAFISASKFAALKMLK